MVNILNNFINFFKGLVGDSSSQIVPIEPTVLKPTPPIVPPQVANTNVIVSDTQNTPPWIKGAISLMGVREVPGNSDNPEILEWAKDVGQGQNYTHDSIPWCGLFMAMTQKLGNEPGIKTPLWARAWADYGVSLHEPAYGCIMVFARDGGGHVAYYVSEDDSYFHVLGGNQSDMVNVTRVAKNRAIAFRWPPNADQYFKVGRIRKAFDGKVSRNEA